MKKNIMVKVSAFLASAVMAISAGTMCASADEAQKAIELTSTETLAGKIILMDKGLFDILPAATKKELLSKVMKEVSWNGKNAVIHLLAEA